MNASTLISPITPTTTTGPMTDFTRGAIRFGIRGPRVLVESSILDDYAECDPTMGLNTAGVILSVLTQRVTLAPGGGRDDSIVVALHRRADGQPVELELSLSRSRQHGQECLRLTRLFEKLIEE